MIFLAFHWVYSIFTVELSLYFGKMETRKSPVPKGARGRRPRAGRGEALKARGSAVTRSRVLATDPSTPKSASLFPRDPHGRLIRGHRPRAISPSQQNCQQKSRH